MGSGPQLATSDRHSSPVRARDRLQPLWHGADDEKSIGFSGSLLALHVILGTLLVIFWINLVVLSVRARMRFPVILSSLILACLLGAWAGGEGFTQKVQAGFSMSMDILTAVALTLLCTAINIRKLSASASSSAPASN